MRTVPCCLCRCWTDKRCHRAAESNPSTAFPGLAQGPNHTWASGCLGKALRQVIPQSDKMSGATRSQLIMRGLDANPWGRKSVASNQGVAREHQLLFNVWLSRFL